MNPRPRGGRLFQRLSIRHKLLALVLVPLGAVLPLLGALLLWWGSAAYDRLLITKVRADLAVAHGYFERVRGEVGASTAAVAESHALQRALAGSTADVTALLEQLRRREGLDFLTLGPAAAQAAGERGMARIEVLAPAALAALAPALHLPAPVPLLATRNAAPGTRTQEERAMVLLATRPVSGADGQPLGLLQGGMVLNRNLAFIDHINAIVYPEGSLPFGSLGTTTLFLDDVRISTNVRLFGGERAERAIGTRVSQAVRDAVLGAGGTWLDSAFVVQDWYVSAYEPLVDGAGARVGMLYVGFLERPFTLVKLGVLASVAATFAAAMAAAAFVSLRWARSIFRPLEQMAAVMQRVEGGELAARVGDADAPPDEIGRLAGHLDHLLAVIDSNTRELDAKVAERTRQLAEAQSHLVRNEKLAAVGQLTASIAHEINNPIAVMQGNLDLMRELLGAAGTAPVRAELRLLDEQVERMRLIVTQLLQFARPTEYAGYVDAVDPERVLDDCLVLVGHRMAQARIRVRRAPAGARTVAINRQELQQVLVNLLVNAIDAMPDGGTLDLATRDATLPDGKAGVEIEVADSGPGIAPELLGCLFQPFITRKKDGTGLGLWISRNLVERYGGDIVATNRSHGGGAVFTVRLRAEPT